MSSFPKITAITLAAASTLLFLTGCETSRTNKRHSDAFAVSDETTAGKPDPAFVADPSGQPPVPGSPTAAGPDGKQPYDDSLARAGEGAEEGIAPPPATQIKDSFQRQ